MSISNLFVSERPEFLDHHTVSEKGRLMFKRDNESLELRPVHVFGTTEVAKGSYPQPEPVTQFYDYLSLVNAFVNGQKQEVQRIAVSLSDDEPTYKSGKVPYDAQKVLIRNLEYSLMDKLSYDEIVDKSKKELGFLNPSKGSIVRAKKMGWLGTAVFVGKDIWHEEIIAVCKQEGILTHRCSKYKDIPDYIYYTGCSADKAYHHKVKNFFGFSLQPHAAVTHGKNFETFMKVDHGYYGRYERDNYVADMFWYDTVTCHRYGIDSVKSYLETSKRIEGELAELHYNLMSTFSIDVPVLTPVCDHVCGVDTLYCDGKLIDSIYEAVPIPDISPSAALLTDCEGYRLIDIDGEIKTLDVVSPEDFSRRRQALEQYRDYLHYPLVDLTTGFGNFAFHKALSSFTSRSDNVVRARIEEKKDIIDYRFYIRYDDLRYFEFKENKIKRDHGRVCYKPFTDSINVFVHHTYDKSYIYQEQKCFLVKPDDFLYNPIASRRGVYEFDIQLGWFRKTNTTRLKKFDLTNFHPVKHAIVSKVDESNEFVGKVLKEDSDYFIIDDMAKSSDIMVAENGVVLSKDEKGIVTLVESPNGSIIGFDGVRYASHVISLNRENSCSLNQLVASTILDPSTYMTVCHANYFLDDYYDFTHEFEGGDEIIFTL